MANRASPRLTCVKINGPSVYDQSGLKQGFVSSLGGLPSLEIDKL